MRRHRWVVAAAAASLVLAACSSNTGSGAGSSTSAVTSAAAGSSSAAQPAPSAAASSAGSPSAASPSAAGSSAAGAPASTSAAGGSTSPATFSGKPLKVGFVDTISGGFANVGKLALQGANIAVDQWNAQGGVLGRKVELVVKDEQLSPTKSVQDMRELASAGVDLVTGFTSSADVLAAKSIVSQNNMAVVTAGVTDTSLTTTQHSPNIYEIAANVHMLNVAAAHLAATEWKDVKTWDGVNYDYLTGHDAWTEFQQELSSQHAPGTIGKGVFVPLTAAQDTSYINSLLAANPDPKTTGLYYFLYGGGGVQFAKQSLPLKLLSQYKAVAGVGTGDMELASALGASLPHVYLIYDYYYQAYNNPTNTAFVNAWKKLPAAGGLKLYGPNPWTYEGYTAMLAILNAVKTAGSADSSAVLKALSTMSFDSPMGKVHFDKSNILAAPVSVWQCQGDSSAKYGYKCFGAESVPPSVTLAK